MSFDELQNAARKLSSAWRAALAEYLLRTLRTSQLEAKEKGAALQALFSSWDAEDETEDPRELEARRQDLQAFQKALNANRPSERPLSP